MYHFKDVRVGEIAFPCWFKQSYKHFGIGILLHVSALLLETKTGIS